VCALCFYWLALAYTVRRWHCFNRCPPSLPGPWHLCITDLLDEGIDVDMEVTFDPVLQRAEVEHGEEGEPEGHTVFACCSSAFPPAGFSIERPDGSVTFQH